MRIAVVHHRYRGEKDADLAALAASASRACEQGASAVVLPFVPSLADLTDAERVGFMEGIRGCPEGSAVFISFDDGSEVGPRVLDTPLGRTALLGGDTCFRVDVLTGLLPERLDAMVWRPGAESELQSEAITEFAVGCAPALAGILLVAECTGSAGDGCEGTSAIIHAAQIVAEADGDDDEVIVADLDVPQRAVEPDLRLPVPPPILEQRLAVHEGRKPRVDYPADLT